MTAEARQLRAAVNEGSWRASPASFRDPAGFIFHSGGVLYRQVNRAYRADFEKLNGSGLYRSLVERGLLVRHEEVTGVEADPERALTVIRPEPVDFISYPYEWSFSQLQDAALLTLDVQLAALERGMSLKDASAYNVQFQRGRPIFIDTLSFETYVEGRPWVAYRQFCKHFLAPLALMALKDVSLGQLLRVHVDGIPLELASKLLPARTWFRFGLLTHLHLHARAQQAYSGTEGRRAGERQRVARVSRLGLQGLLGGLRKQVSKLSWRPPKTEWGGYYRATNYSDQAFEEKRRWVAEFLELAAPETVWDLGANTGVFSRLASERGASTVAFDIDPVAVEDNYTRVRAEEPKALLPLLLDLTNPSPGLGWSGTERDSLAGRGPVDCVMALALIHHLAISNNVPLVRVSQFLAGLGRHLIIEFVPKADSQVQRLLSGREDIFEDYDRAGFEAAFRRHFTIERSEPVKGTERILYFMKALP